MPQSRYEHLSTATKNNIALRADRFSCCPELLFKPAQMQYWQMMMMMMIIIMMMMMIQYKEILMVELCAYCCIFVLTLWIIYLFIFKTMEGLGSAIDWARYRLWYGSETTSCERCCTCFILKFSAGSFSTSSSSPAQLVRDAHSRRTHRRSWAQTRHRLLVRVSLVRREDDSALFLPSGLLDTDAAQSPLR